MLTLRQGWLGANDNAGVAPGTLQARCGDSPGVNADAFRASYARKASLTTRAAVPLPTSHPRRASEGCPPALC